MTPRIRGRRLQRIRRQHFAREPLCVRCLASGRISAATELDHIRALIHDGEERECNRQGLCAECHRQKTAEDFGRKPRRRLTIGLDGWPVGGIPPGGMRK